MPTYIFDDYYGDERPGAGIVVPTYLPVVGQWDWIGGTCASCTLQTNIDIPIDPTRAQNATWHSVTVSPDEPATTISINFTGTAVTAYCLLPPDLGPWITSYMNVSFVLDDNTVGKFERIASGDDWTYNYPVYSVSNLENRQHTFVVQPRADVNTSYLVFDYFTYEFDGNPPPSSSSSSSTPTTSTSPLAPSSHSQRARLSVGAIAGSAVGGILVLIIAILAVWFIRRWQSRRRRWPMKDEPKEDIDVLSYPQTTPCLASDPAQHAPKADATSSLQKEALHPRDGPAPSDGSAPALPASATHWPPSVADKRALAGASMQRVAEIEARVAQRPGADEENGRLRREIDALQAQVGQLHVALEQQAAEMREGVLYERGEAPPGYEEEGGAGVVV
ncbi:hypothetical protein PsYK624_139340 [Phanerochaete sordida]|uniref:Uncharacterized protein n=1 Tax=Phanerochaete sordida TaxID=48140 RepID=A0A9P3GKT6_9APHY|nr:hypothetical protein PsYK624_139340 [Phanerochaete sordida]